MMQSLPILWNAHNASFLLVTALNAPILIFIAVRIYRRDAGSKINQLFTTALILMLLTFVLFPLGGLLWYVQVVGVPAILITTRLMQFSSFLSMVFMAWCARVLYLGEGTWNRTDNLLVVGSAAFVFVTAMLAPDAVYIIAGPPDSDIIDTGEGIIYRWVYYLGAFLFIFAALSYFVRTYFDYRNDDPILERQALLLILGLLSAFACLAIAFLSTLLTTYAFTPLMLTSMTVGVLFMSFSFSEESGLDRLKITSGLKRLKVLLRKGKIAIASAQLEFLEDLIDPQAHPAFFLHLMVVDAKLHMYNGLLDDALAALDSAFQICDSEGNDRIRRELETEKKHLDVLRAVKGLETDLEDLGQEEFQEPNLDDVVAYLDRVLEEQDMLSSAQTA